MTVLLPSITLCFEISWGTGRSLSSKLTSSHFPLRVITIVRTAAVSLLYRTSGRANVRHDEQQRRGRNYQLISEPENPPAISTPSQNTWSICPCAKKCNETTQTQVWEAKWNIIKLASETSSHWLRTLPGIEFPPWGGKQHFATLITVNARLTNWVTNHYWLMQGKNKQMINKWYLS